MRQVFGGLLLGCGILVAGLSGLCTVLIAGMTMFEPGSGGEVMTILPAALIFGGVPFLVGVGLFFAGRALLRDRAGEAYVAPPAPPAGPLDPATMARPDPDRDNHRE